MFENLVLAQTGMEQVQSAVLSVLIVLAVLVLPFILGAILSRMLRMPGYGSSIGWCLLAVSLSASAIYFYFPPKLGVDLSGGSILIYQIDDEATKQMTLSTGRGFDMEALCQALTMRVNPDGLKEIVIRPFGEDQVEVIVPEVDPAEVKRIKDILNQPGFLEFRIVADAREDAALVALAREQEKNPERRTSRFVYSEEKDDEGNDKRVGYWARIKRGVEEDGKPGQYKWREGLRYVVRNGNTGEMLPFEILQQAHSLAAQEKGTALEEYFRDQNIVPEVLMRIDPEYQVNGDDLGPTEKSLGMNGWQINFTIKQGEPATRMGQLTGRNLRGPDEPNKRFMAILLDGDVISAPAIQGRITDRGQITGRFTEEEVSFIVEVLRAGQLPAVLQKQPASQNLIDPTLGNDTIRSGTLAAGVSLIVVMIFMLIYYRFAGIVANIALALNISLTLALMMLFKAPLTLPGLAGLVLTVGMAVDANVLIFERIREELEKGSALRMALRNGFERAIVTIIDSNLTTLFTAIVLYLRGTDQVRGFATTLALGICTSMFTACFVARVIFDIAERNRWIKTLSMMRMFSMTNIQFTRMMVPAMVISLLFMAVGATALVFRAKEATLFDIDLVGGTKVTWEFLEQQNPDDVRKKIQDTFQDQRDESGAKVSYTFTPTQSAEKPKGFLFDVTSSFQDESKLQEIVVNTFKKADGESMIKTYEMKIDSMATTTATRPLAPGEAGEPSDQKPPTDDVPSDIKVPETTDVTPPTTDEDKKVEEKKDESEKTEEAKEPGSASQDSEKPADAETESASTCQAPGEESEEETKPTDDDKKPAEDASAEEKPADTSKPESEDKPADNDEKSAEEKPADTSTQEEPASATEKKDEAPAVPSDLKPESSGQRVVSITTEAKLSFPKAPITADALYDRVKLAAEKLFGESPVITVVEADGSGKARSNWTVNVSLSEEKSRKLLESIQSEMDGTPVFQASTTIGGQVASNSKRDAIQAVLISLLMIMAYIWLRFHKLSWGIAAVAALVHDTLVMLGAVAISFWLAGALGVLGIEEFRISLTVIAAFLTLIGYSINDTIVIFDRIREVRGKNPELTAEMVNTSINQTLSRTVLTSGTTLLVLLVLYIWGGAGVHAFAFSLLVGVISGTYSTVFIAAPLLLWMLGRGKNSFLSS